MMKSECPPILCLGLSCATQYTVVMNQLERNEVNRVSCSMTHAGGKAVNVAKALNVLKRYSTLVGVCGHDAQNIIDEDLDEPYILNDLTEIQAHNRLCITLIEEAQRTCTELVAPAPTFTEREERHLMASFEENIRQAGALVIAGSLPSDLKKDYYAQFLRAARALNIPSIIDTSGPALLAALPEQPFLVKLNVHELETVGKSPKRLIQQGAQNVLVTAGAGVCVLQTPTHTFRFIPPQVAAVNTIGCGDCVTAGIIAALTESSPLPLEDVVCFGLACGSANATAYAPIGFKGSAARKLAEEVKRI